jgi:hypothetical protein
VAHIINANYCKEWIYSGQRGDWGGRQCTRKPVLDGYCKFHHPDTQKRRRAALEEKWAREREASDRKYAIESAEREVVSVAKNLRSLGMLDGSMLEAVDALVKLEEAK